MTEPARHVWYELMTSDQDAAERFYAEVVGWRMADSGMAEMRYTIIHAGELPIGGIMSIAGGPPPAWIGYVGVADVDAKAAELTGLGGTILRPAEDIPDVGRFCVVADPQGASFVLFTPFSDDMPQAPYMTPGTVGWHELQSSDWSAAWDFYAALFGWVKAEAMDMGPMGTYQIFSTGGDPIGAMFDNPNVPQPMWLYYFAVGDIDAAKARIEGAGGTILMGPMEVPGGMWIVQATDPQGAMFALVGARG